MTLTLNNNFSALKVGDYFWCKYTVTTTNTVGIFSDIATKTDAEVASQLITVASSNSPNGYFKFIMVEDWSGKKRLIADRNIQHSISWDVLNSSGIVSGLPVLFSGYDPKTYQFSMRLLTGGISATDKDNEWDKYIVNSNLNGNITVGDNSVWNWSAVYSWTSTTHTSNSTRVLRGSQSSDRWYGIASNSTHNVYGFRPVLEIESSLLNKSFILTGDGYKKLSQGSPEVPTIPSGTVDLIPKMTSFTTDGVTVSSNPNFTDASPIWQAFDDINDNVSTTNTGWLSGVTTTTWIQVDFGIKKVVGKYALSCYGKYLASSFDCMPKSWTLEGSNMGSFTGEQIVLDNQINQTAWSHLEKRIYEFSNNIEFQYYRFNITSNNGHTRVAIGEVELFQAGKPSIPATPSSWKTVSPTLPTLTQFKEEGMSDLSVLDRKVQILTPIQMNNDTMLDDDGKVFKATVDLKKIFDVRKIEIK